MGDAFRGLTLRIGADARPLQSALASIKSAASSAEQQLRAMNKALNFDSGNTAAMSSRLALMQDKTKLAARSVADIGIAMSQAAAKTVEFSEKSGMASGKIKDVADSTREVYSTVQRVQSEYNHVNEELETIYNAVRKIAAEEKGWKQDSKELDDYMSKLKSNYGKTGEEAQKLTAEMKSYVRFAELYRGLGDQFGLRHTYGDAKKLVTIMEELRSEHKRLQGDLSNIHAIEGYRAMQTQLIAVKSEMRAAAAEATRFSTELYRMGSSEALHNALADVRALDGAIDNARASTRSMEEAFRAMPTSMEAAKAKVRATREEAALLASKLEKAREVVRKIESDSAFDKQAMEIRNVHAALAQAQTDATQYSAKIHEASERVKALNDQIEHGNPAAWKEAGTSLEKLQSELAKAKAQLESYRAAFVEVDARHRSASMAVAYREAREEVIRLEAELAKLDSANQRLNTLGERFGTIRTMGYGLYSTITPAIMMMGRYAINATETIDAAYRNMRKTVNGTEEDFEHLKEAAIDFSRTHITTAEQILEIESIGGQLGIAVDNLEAFGETISNLDIATNIDAEDIATYVGQLSNIMRDIDTSNVQQYQQDLTSFSDALVRLGNNSAAQESNIMKVMMRIASLGNISGFTTPQLLGISTAIAATGQGAEAAGTAIARTFSNIEAAVGAGGEKLQAFADVSGMSAQEFASAWNGDPITAFTAFISGLRAIDEAGGSVDGTLASLGINSVRQKQALEGLTNTLDIMKTSVGMSEDAWNGLSTQMRDGSIEQAGDAAREAGRKSEGFSGAIQILRNNATALAESLGNGAAPLISLLGGLFEGLTGAVNAMPGPLKTIIVLFGGLAAAAGPASIAIGAVGTAWTNFSKMRIDKKSHRLELKALAEAALEAATAEEVLAKKQEEQALFAMRAAAADGDDAAAKVAAGAAASAHTRAVEAENAVQAANTQVTIANGGVKGWLAGINEKLAASNWRLAASFATTNGMVLLAVAGVAAATAALVALWDATKDWGDASNDLTVTSKNLSDRTSEAKAEYERLAAEFGESSNEALAAKAAYEELNAELENSSKTYGELFIEMQNMEESAKNLRQSLSESKDEMESEVGSLLHTVDAIEKLSAADDEASNGQLEAYIISLNSQLEGCNLTVADATGKTEAYKAALASVEDRARQMRLDNAIDGFVELSNKASELQMSMAKIREDTGLSEDMLAMYAEAAKAGARNADVTAGNAAQYFDLKTQLEAIEAEQKKYGDEVQANADKTKACAEATKLMNDYGKSQAEALAIVNDMFDTSVTELDLQADAELRAAEEAAALEEELESLYEGVEATCEKYPELAAAIDQSGMSYEALAQWLYDSGISVEDFAQGVEDMASKASDGFNKIDTESGTSLDEFISNLESNKALMESWGSNMDELWTQYSDTVSENGKEAVANFLQYLEEAGPEQAGLVEELANRGNLEEVATAWAETGQAGREAYMSGIGALSEEAQTMAAAMAQAIEDELSGLMEINGEIWWKDNADEEKSRIESLSDRLKSAFSQPTSVSIKTNEDVTSNVWSINNSLRNLTTYKEVEIHTVFTREGNAEGGVTPSYIRGWASGALYDKLISAIPMHASGALNGIVARPTLTNIGWVGEDGAEAILHMGHAGGAVIPLTNQRYVRPFAQAVAANMGNRPSVTVNMNLNYDASDDAQQMLRDIERGLENYLNLEA